MGNCKFFNLLYEAVGHIRSESLVILDSLEGEESLMSLLIPSLGLDSVEIFELVGYLEDNSGVEIPESKVFSFKTVGELKAFMALN
ncbi:MULTISPECIES: acyl carrier protein [unclassified Pseudomonas]|uniref:acyl carrier protein n=1 Tax=unclassified Pseudomonas TaxID=196821 RepID=UPI0008125E88|nr:MULTISPECIES: acyl carrier protein [unclassified Pseudomonas]PIB40767.1 hypothetical protein AOA59_26530 [Pseudomonas sp. 2822-15]TKJ73232.1 acyl carrier protein [Pseudomonas sp. CFBP13509]CRM49860.1 acyl carrier protein [Pseudomonas sp. 8 R 14]SAM32839.1 acyl carrier protein [Pseudomonas sp. 1 R 17]